MKTNFKNLAFAGGVGQTEILRPDRNDVVGRFAEAFAAHERRFAHRNRAERRFHVGAAHRTLLDGLG